MLQWNRLIRHLFFATALSVCAVESLAADSSAVETATENVKGIYHERRPNGIGILYEISQNPSNVSANMTRNGKKQNVDLEVSNLFGITYQRSLNAWISLFSILAHQRVDVDYIPRDDSDRERTLTANELFLQGGLEIGFPFIHARNYQIRGLGFFGLTFGGVFLNDDFYNNTTLWGYSRGIGLQVNIHRIAILAGFRSTHFYFHTNHDGNNNDKDNSFMLDFDTMGNPYFAFGIGF